MKMAAGNSSLSQTDSDVKKSMKLISVSKRLRNTSSCSTDDDDIDDDDAVRNDDDDDNDSDDDDSQVEQYDNESTSAQTSSDSAESHSVSSHSGSHWSTTPIGIDFDDCHNDAEMGADSAESDLGEAESNSIKNSECSVNSDDENCSGGNNLSCSDYSNSTDRHSNSVLSGNVDAACRASISSSGNSAVGSSAIFYNYSRWDCNGAYIQSPNYDDCQSSSDASNDSSHTLKSRKRKRELDSNDSDEYSADSDHSLNNDPNAAQIQEILQFPQATS